MGEDDSSKKIEYMAPRIKLGDLKNLENREDGRISFNVGYLPRPKEEVAEEKRRKTKKKDTKEKRREVTIF
ncbi:MAG: hypothetical protein ABEJ24_03195 [Candidatus Magasanikbacteria bacterium]